MAAPKGNKYALGNKGGRPPIYESPEELSAAVENYFSRRGKATITGLTLFLGFESRSSLDDYCNRNDEFSYIIKRAKLAVENSYEMSGTYFDIFALKNMGWKDRQELTGADGKDLSQVVIFKIPDNGRTVNNSTTEGVSGEGT